MAADLHALLADLDAESRVVADLIAPLDPTDWDRPTPAAGWAIRDQISHLAYFDETTTLAVTDPERFRRDAVELTALGPDFPDAIAREYAKISTNEVSNWFRHARAELLTAFAGCDPKQRMPWYGPDMSAASAVTARLMETWAHGYDIADALGTRPEPTARLRHIAHLGACTFGFAFTLRGRPVPTTPVRVELAAPDGASWVWGPPAASDRVTGPALDFCLAVTQRRNLADLALDVSGPVAAEWMSIAQAFAGAPGPGRRPRERA